MNKQNIDSSKIKSQGTYEMNQLYPAENVRNTYLTKKTLQLLHTSADSIPKENNQTQR